MKDTWFYVADVDHYGVEEKFSDSLRIQIFHKDLIWVV